MNETDRGALQSDLQARKDALNIAASFVVQAPAGSGKTELLIQRYLKLLSVVDHPEEVLAITFTRKAAAEMQTRVLEALQLARSGTRPDEVHRELTFSLAQAVLQADRNNDWQLSGNPRRLRIMTMDSVNASIARSQPLSMPEHAMGARVVVGAELRSLHREAALASLDWLTEPGDFQAATAKVLSHVDNNVDLYVSYLARMLDKRDQWLPFIGRGKVDDPKRLRAELEDNLDYVVEEHLKDICAALAQVDLSPVVSLFDFAAAQLANETANPIVALRDTTAMPAPAIEYIEQWHGLAELLLTKQGGVRKRLNKNQGFPPTAKEQKGTMQTVLLALAEKPAALLQLHSVRQLPPTRYSEEQWEVLLALFKLLPLAVAELKRLFSNNAAIDHTEVAIIADAALGAAQAPSDVALLLDYQIRHLLIDEMQDTSFAQYRMIEALTRGWEDADGRSLFCVGDPMQSVYRFRDAEVGQFQILRESGIGDISVNSLLLRQNFRSGEHLVEWFNETFPRIFAPDDDPRRGAVRYASAVAAPSLQGQGAVTVHPVFSTDPIVEADTGLQVVKDLLANNPDDSVVVLVRGRTQLTDLLGKLRREGVPYNAIEIDRLTDLPEIIDVLALTRAITHLGDRMAWLGLLRAPWIALTWSDLHTLVNDAPQNTVWELLNDTERLGRLSTQAQQALEWALPILAKILRVDRISSLRDRVEQAWLTLGGAAALNDRHEVDNVYRYLAVLQRIESAGSLIDVADLEAILEQEHVSASGSGMLNIMTMHRSKGLQFDHVILFGLGRKTGQSDYPVLSWFDMPQADNPVRKIISPIASRADANRDPIHQYIRRIDAEKTQHEDARLLYVACTRAKRSLHLIGHVSANDGGDSFKPPRTDCLLHRLWRFAAPGFDKAFASVTLPDAVETPSVLMQPSLHRLSSHWQLPSVDPLPGIDVAIEDVDTDSEVEFYWVGTDARIAGTLVHRWLQLIADGFLETSVESVRAHRAVCDRWLREYGLTDDAAAVVAERVENAVVATLQDPQGLWVLSGEGHAELRLSGMIADEVVNVVLDRVRIDKDGTHWIIDYKTSVHEGGNLQGFLDVEVARYREQLQRYAAIYSAWSGRQPRCALYFPLLRSFVEVEH